jgi:hypothetical protein
MSAPSGWKGRKEDWTKEDWTTESEDAQDFAEDSTAGKLLPSDVANGSSDS